MMQKNKYKDITWIDLENPTSEEIRILMDKYDIDPIIGNELLSPTIRPRVDVHNNYIYLILHFPISSEDREKNPVEGINQKIQEVDFIIGKDFIITAHYETVDALHDFSKIFEVNSILSKSSMGTHAGFVFFFMIQFLYHGLQNKVESLREKLDEVEEKIFTGREKEVVLELSSIKRTLLTYKESIVTHKEVLVTFEIAAESFFGDQFKYYLRSILGEYYKVKTSIESAKEYLGELRETNDSLLSTKQNEIMKTLTVVTFIVLPLSLIASIFGMNTIHTPFVGGQNDFVIVISIMFALTLLMFTFFKEKDWL